MEENQNQTQDWGFHTFLRGILLFGFTMLFISLLISGNINYYIAPKMLPFIYFATFVFFGLSIVQIMRSTPKGQQEELACDCGTSHQIAGPGWKKLSIYMIFIIPLLTGFMLPDKILDSSVAAKRGVILGSGLNSGQFSSSSPSMETRAEEDILEQQEPNQSTTPRADEYLASLEEEEELEHTSLDDFYAETNFDEFYQEIIETLLAQEPYITIDDEWFLDSMMVLDMHLDQFIGKQVEINGFVYREEGIDPDELVVARFSMTCCTADSAVYGLLVKGEEALAYENDTWVRVRGTIDRTTFHDWELPFIHIDQIEEIEAPDTPYVYPSGF